MTSRAAGVSLAEAIVACFVLASAMAVSATLYHTALNHSVRIDRKYRAARVVERRIEEIRGWSREHHGTNGDLVFPDQLSTFQGELTDPEYPEFEVTTKVISQNLYSPSSAFEDISFAAQADRNVPRGDKDKQRVLNDSAYLIEVKGSWGTSAKDSIVVRTLIADPVRDYGWSADDAHNAVEITGASSPLNPDQSLSLTATIKDAHGHEVRNAVVEWYVDPKSSGKGTIRTNPNRSDEAKFFNFVEVDKDPDIIGDEIKVYAGGSVRIFARVRLGGLEAVNQTEEILLATP